MSSDSEADDMVTQTVERFWGTVLETGKASTVSLAGSNLQVSQACLDPEGDGDTVATLFVTTDVSGRVAACTMTPTAPTAPLSLSFFTHDDEVTFEAVGAPIHLTGVVSLDPVALFAEETDSEEEEEEEVEAAPAPAPAPTPSKAKAAKAKADKAKADKAKADKAKADKKGKRKASVDDAAPPTPAAAATPEPPKSKKKQKRDAAATDPKAVAPKRERTVKLPNGLHITDTVKGLGPKPTPGRKVTIHYTGRLTDGKVFDKSKKPFEFRIGVGKVVPGFDQGVATMRVGGKRTLVIPPKLAYGKRGIPGAIPKNATLTFDIELIKA